MTEVPKTVQAMPDIQSCTVHSVLHCWNIAGLNENQLDQKYNKGKRSTKMSRTFGPQPDKSAGPAK